VSAHGENLLSLTFAAIKNMAVNKVQYILYKRFISPVPLSTAFRPTLLITSSWDDTRGTFVILFGSIGSPYNRTGKVLLSRRVYKLWIGFLYFIVCIEKKTTEFRVSSCTMCLYCVLPSFPTYMSAYWSVEDWLTTFRVNTRAV